MLVGPAIVARNPNSRLILNARTILHFSCQQRRQLHDDSIESSARGLSRIHITSKTRLSIPCLNRGQSRTFVTTAAATDLDAQIIQYYKETRPSESVYQARRKTRARVQSAINKNFGEGYLVKSFGSTAYGQDHSKSDLDLVVLDSHFPAGYRTSAKKRRKSRIYYINTLSSVLKQAGFRIEQAIPTALVPIVKFVDTKTGIRCDLNVNERLGIRNTSMLARYCEILPQLPALVFLVKKWAKSHNLNNPSTRQKGVPASFSSYALTLMIIGHLQLEGLLPNLQEGFHSDRQRLPDGKNIFWVRTRRGYLACDTRFHTEVSWQPPVVPSVSALFESWLRYWEQFEHEHYGMSVREGKLLHRSSGIVLEDSESGLLDADESTGVDETDIVPDPDPDTDTDTDGYGGEPRQKLLAQAMQSAPPTASGTTSQVGGQSNLNKTKSDLLVVMDPFILTKNVCTNIGLKTFSNFRESCRQSLSVMKAEGGCELGDILGQEQESSVGKKHKLHKGPGN